MKIAARLRTYQIKKTTNKKWVKMKTKNKIYKKLSSRSCLDKQKNKIRIPSRLEKKRSKLRNKILFKLKFELD
jgi:hypothetical protein